MIRRRGRPPGGRVQHARAAGNPTAVAMARFAEGRAAAAENLAAALAALDEARAVAAGVGCRPISALALTVTVELRGRHGPPEKALALFHDAMRLWQATANETLLVTLLCNLVTLLVRTGRDAEAVDLAGTLRHASHIAIYRAETGRIDAALAAARRRLGAERYDAAWSVGTQRSVDEAAERAERLLAEPVTATGVRQARGVITCVVEYVIDPTKTDAFERSARRWMELVDLHGGIHHGYFLPGEGASDKALALFSFPSLASYEKYRERFGADPDFVAADRIRDESGCVLRYERTFMRPLLPQR